VWTEAPISVMNKATVCDGTLWCQESNTVFNPQFDVYLPVIFKQ
jgi:hypothetical protein